MKLESWGQVSLTQSWYLFHCNSCSGWHVHWDHAVSQMGFSGGLNSKGSVRQRRETRVWFLGGKDLLEKLGAMATHPHFAQRIHGQRSSPSCSPGCKSWRLTQWLETATVLQIEFRNSCERIEGGFLFIFLGKVEMLLGLVWPSCLNFKTGWTVWYPTGSCPWGSCAATLSGLSCLLRHLQPRTSKPKLLHYREILPAELPE